MDHSFFLTNQELVLAIIVLVLLAVGIFCYRQMTKKYNEKPSQKPRREENRKSVKTISVRDITVDLQMQTVYGDLVSSTENGFVTIAGRLTLYYPIKKTDTFPSHQEKWMKSWSNMGILEKDQELLPSHYRKVELSIYFASSITPLPLVVRADERERYLSGKPQKITMFVPSKGNHVAVESDSLIIYIGKDDGKDDYSPQIRAVIVKFAAYCINCLINATEECNLWDLQTGRFSIRTAITIHEAMMLPSMVDFSDAKHTFKRMIRHRATEIEFSSTQIVDEGRSIAIHEHDMFLDITHHFNHNKNEVH